MILIGCQPSSPQNPEETYEWSISACLHILVHLLGRLLSDLPGLDLALTWQCFGQIHGLHWCFDWSLTETWMYLL